MTAFDTAWDLLKMPYHGTNDKAAKKIMIEGLKPHFNENSERMGIPEVVFATDDYEEALAHAEDDTYGTDLNPVVIHISDEVKSADDSYAPWYLYDKIIPPDKLRIMQKSFDTAWDLLKAREYVDARDNNGQATVYAANMNKGQNLWYYFAVGNRIYRRPK